MTFYLENIILPSIDTPQILFTLYHDWNYVAGLRISGYSRMSFGESQYKGINNTLTLDKRNLDTVKIVCWEVKAEDVFMTLDKVTCGARQGSNPGIQ